RLIDSFHLLRHDRPDLKDVQLVIIGDEISKYATLRRAVHRHKLHKHVRFFGFVPDQTLAALYRLAAVFVFPSLYEGFGLPPLEARTPALGNRVALVHDWLTGMRGGEKVLEAIAELYPDAPIYTLLHVKGSVSRALESRRIFCSFVQWLPGSARHYRGYLPLF